MLKGITVRSWRADESPGHICQNEVVELRGLQPRGRRRERLYSGRTITGSMTAAARWPGSHRACVWRNITIDF